MTLTSDSSVDLVELAELEQQLGNHDAALRGFATVRDVPDLAARVERNLGLVAFETGRPADAVSHLQRAAASGESGPAVTWPLIMALCNLGRHAEARMLAQSQLEGPGRGDPSVRLDALANLGTVAGMEGSLAEAEAHLREARLLATELGDVMRLANVVGDLAGVCFLEGRIAESARLLDEATALSHRLGSRRFVSLHLGNLAHVRLAAGDLRGAGRAAAAGAEAALAIGDVGTALNVLEVPAVVAELSGDQPRAARWWERCARAEERMGRSDVAAVCWFRAAGVAAAVGNDDVARAATERAETAAVGMTTEELELHRERAAAALAGRPAPPPEAVTDAVSLPPLDTAYPDATPRVVDELFDRVDRQLAAAGALSTA